jgi:hypothetical protein
MHFAPHNGGWDLLPLDSCGGVYLMPGLLPSPALKQPPGCRKILKYSNTIPHCQGNSVWMVGDGEILLVLWQMSRHVTYLFDCALSGILSWGKLTDCMAVRPWQGGGGARGVCAPCCTNTSSTTQWWVLAHILAISWGGVELYGGEAPQLPPR